MRVAISTSFSDTLNFDWSRRVSVPKVSGSFTKSTMHYAKLNSYVFLKNSTPVPFVAFVKVVCVRAMLVFRSCHA